MVYNVYVVVCYKLNYGTGRFRRVARSPAGFPRTFPWRWSRRYRRCRCGPRRTRSSCPLPRTACQTNNKIKGAVGCLYVSKLQFSTHTGMARLKKTGAIQHQNLCPKGSENTWNMNAAKNKPTIFSLTQHEGYDDGLFVLLSEPPLVIAVKSTKLLVALTGC